ncbi:hypothetical protein Tco_0397828 [Tanacetum coccineum]
MGNRNPKLQISDVVRLGRNTTRDHYYLQKLAPGEDEILTGILPPFVLFAQAFAAVITSALTSSLYYVCISIRRMLLQKYAIDLAYYGSIGILKEIDFRENLRKAAVSALPEVLHSAKLFLVRKQKDYMFEILTSAKLAVEREQYQGHDESYVKHFIAKDILPALRQALYKVKFGLHELETQTLLSIEDAIGECYQISIMIQWKGSFKSQKQERIEG